MCAARVLVLLALPGCGPDDGADGGDCIRSGGWLNPGYSCHAGLVCNTGRDPMTCERPNLGLLGAPCGSDQNCQKALWCPAGRQCAARIKEGDPCPAGVGCEPGLICKKEASGITCQKP